MSKVASLDPTHEKSPPPVDLRELLDRIEELISPTLVFHGIPELLKLLMIVERSRKTMALESRSDQITRPNDEAEQSEYRQIYVELLIQLAQLDVWFQTARYDNSFEQLVKMRARPEKYFLKFQEECPPPLCIYHDFSELELVDLGKTFERCTAFRNSAWNWITEEGPRWRLASPTAAERAEFIEKFQEQFPSPRIERNLIVAIRYYTDRVSKMSSRDLLVPRKA